MPRSGMMPTYAPAVVQMRYGLGGEVHQAWEAGPVLSIVAWAILVLPRRRVLA